MKIDAAIEVSNLCRTFALSRTQKVRALDGVSCVLRPGTCLAVVGESGSGKTTLARVIVGLERADSGEVRIGGVSAVQADTRRSRRERAKVVQMVFQDPQGSLNRRLPAGAAIDEVLRVHSPQLSKPERRRRTLELFADVGLNQRHADALPSALSGGQKQRVAIARALAAEPRVLVLDEAVSALDVSVQAQVLDLLRRLRQEHALSYVFITHDLSVVREIADDVIVMRHGVVVESGTAAQVLDAPAEPYTKLLLASAPRPGWRPERNLRAKLLGRQA